MSSVPVSIAPMSHVGFDTITQQIERRLLKRGFQFNLMVVGASGLGKTTLVNTIFASHLTESSGRVSAEENITRTPEIKSTSHEIYENEVRLKLNIIDTPGYGDQVNNEKCWEPIVKYIKDQHSQYLRKELTAQREKHLVDTRVHCVLFFIQPNGHGLRPLDIVVLKKICEIANVVPVIAKSDSMTVEERADFKQVLQAEFTHHNFRLYPYDSTDLDDEERYINSQIRQLIPFAIIGSEQNVIVDGKAVRGRKNRWGIINVEDETHCDFSYLRNFLIRTHLQDLIDTTADTHYETFRSKQLLALKENANNSSTNANTSASSASQHAGTQRLSGVN
ncbi:putative Septin ring protein [Nadsonia fulvescens var. elongata DSM 6958]|uniref:Cell division control protein 10 n=1 Tax=Nadsonia fulvescens var. elongata DSM 6958 TaxID=857566 RepID=A0A1E3PQZ5_9ASCO|nr:putative Septin ring protein [Nadsonia fulvescens var. elongata DSM 6958]